MPLKEQSRQIYKTMRGKVVDMHKLVQENEMTPAVGNMKINARGDELGEGGRIVRTREQTQRTLAPQKIVKNIPKVEESAPIAKATTKKGKYLEDPEGLE